VREEWARAGAARLDMLLDPARTAAGAPPSADWGAPQSAAWCAAPHHRCRPKPHATAPLTHACPPLYRLDVLLNGLWGDMLSGVLQRLAPAYIQEVLDIYLSAREDVPVPEFITSMRVVSIAVGARCPFGIRAVRVAKQQAPPDGAAAGDLVLDVDVEVLSSDADVQIHAMVNDLIAPLLARLELRKEDDSYIAIQVSDFRITGTLRVRLSPGARLAAAAFREAPSVALGVSVAYHCKLGFEKRVPLTALPGVERMMQLLVQTEMAEYAVWPRFFAIDLAPPTLLGLRAAPPRAGAQGRMRVTLRGVRGVGAAQRAAAEAEAAEATARAAAHAAAAAAKAGVDAADTPAVAPRPIVPFAVMRWSTGLHSQRTGAAAAPLDANGCTHWVPAAADGEHDVGGGESFVGDVFSPFGMEFLSLELRAPGCGRLGAAQVKLLAVATGETLFSFAGADADAYTALPRVVIGEPREEYEARCEALLPGRARAPGVECSAARNVCDAWVPLDGQPGAAVHLRVEIDWLRVSDDAAGGGATGGASTPAGGLGAAVASARVAAAAQEHTLHVAVLAARGLPPGGTWAIAVGRAGNWQGAARTRPANGAQPTWDDAFELRQSAEAPVLTLLKLRGALQPGPAEESLAAARLPSTQLRAGDTAAMWVKLAPSTGGGGLAGVEVLLRAALCPKM
jgi:hypothetical protein